METSINKIATLAYCILIISLGSLVESRPHQISLDSPDSTSDYHNNSTYPEEKILHALSQLDPTFVRENLLNEVPEGYNDQNDSSNRQKRETSEMELCKSVRKFMPIQTANRASDGEKYYIVNIKEYKQMVEVIQCESEDNLNEKFLCLPSKSKATCKTQNIQKRLLAYNEKKDVIFIENFFIPSACVCVFERIDD